MCLPADKVDEWIEYAKQVLGAPPPAPSEPTAPTAVKPGDVGESAYKRGYRDGEDAVRRMLFETTKALDAAHNRIHRLDDHTDCVFCDSKQQPPGGDDPMCRLCALEAYPRAPAAPELEHAGPRRKGESMQDWLQRTVDSPGGLRAMNELLKDEINILESKLTTAAPEQPAACGWRTGPAQGGAGTAGPCSEKHPSGIWWDGDCLLVVVNVHNNKTDEEWTEYHAVRILCDEESFSVESLNDENDCGWGPESWDWYMVIPPLPPAPSCGRRVEVREGTI